MDALMTYLQKIKLAVSLSSATEPDNPLMFVNHGFTELTGYSAHYAVGRNCRFLQCEDSGHEAREMMHDAIDSGVGVAVCILNERADGERFHNLVCIAPISARDGTDLLLGCQFELRRALDMRDVEDHVRGVNEMISAHMPRTPNERTQIDSIKMRIDNVMMMVRTYEGHSAV
ncbi:MAG: PAS domain-containing protein [Pseudomonadota bacterium]